MNGANPNARDNDGRLPLHWATAAHSVEALELLLKVWTTCTMYNVQCTCVRTIDCTKGLIFLLKPCMCNNVMENFL